MCNDVDDQTDAACAVMQERLRNCKRWCWPFLHGLKRHQRLQLLSNVDWPQCSIWLPVLQLINLVVRTIIDYNDTQSKTHCIWRIVYSELNRAAYNDLNRADPRPHDVWPYTAQCVRCQGRSTNYYQLVLCWEYISWCYKIDNSVQWQAKDSLHFTSVCRC